MNEPIKLLRAVTYFSYPQRCDKLMSRLRWPDGVIACPHCQRNNIGIIATRNLLRCKGCQKQFSLKTGTFFEGSRLELGQWFLAVFAMMHYPELTCKQLAGLLGVTLRTAWQMKKDLSRMPNDGNFKCRLIQLVSKKRAVH